MAALEVKAQFAAGDAGQHGCRHDRPQDLRDHIGQDVLGGEPAAGKEADRDRRIEVAAGDMAHRERHRQHRQSECQRDACEADA
ncbi:hypothetical protein G6F46_015292 [Rhizopus delemar]|nr:hypothetical protein G6F65_021992 [Rhizopus arrhizus]KAG1581943.1 hypothetical protein G6F46_015292 [Rhizopus delemar]